MNNKKNIIQIAVIVVAFGASGLVLYNGFFKSSSTSTVIPTADISASGTPQSGTAVLPYGKNLNFQVLDQQNLQYGVVQYPKLDPQTDVGVLPDKMLQVQTSGQGQ